MTSREHVHEWLTQMVDYGYEGAVESALRLESLKEVYRWRRDGVPDERVDEIIQLIESWGRYVVLDDAPVGMQATIRPYEPTAPRSEGGIVVTRTMDLLAALEWTAEFLTTERDPVWVGSIAVDMTPCGGILLATGDGEGSQDAGPPADRAPIAAESPSDRSDPLPYRFEISIGDWSGDGHGRYDTYTYRSSHPVDVLRDAYHDTKEAHPELCPERICAKYGENTLSPEVWDSITEAMPALSDHPDLDMYEGRYYIYSKLMADYVVEFVRVARPDVTIEPDPAIVPGLTSFEYDAKGRHIGHIGYGLFE